MPNSTATATARHYGRHDLKDRLEEALVAAGLGEGPISAEDLAPLDQFHTRGLAATIELAEAAAITPGMAVIDIGSGLGGPSRYLAATYGCRVEGIDLSPSFVEAATYLAERSGLQDKVTYRCADALALPYKDKRFDLGWTQHVAMNIADRPRLYGEIHRVIRPSGRFVIYDVVAGHAGPIEFPVPWARAPESSFLMNPTAMRETLEAQGFRVLSWADRTEAGAQWFEDLRKARAQSAAPPPLGLNLAMGPDFPAMADNLGKNLREGRAGLVQAVLERL
jgi:ubiquinone/menaquinone biosynthesis C-methylase UbiE